MGVKLSSTPCTDSLVWDIDGRVDAANHDLHNAYLAGRSLGWWNFAGSNLSGAYLRGSTVTFTYFTGANLSGANLSGVQSNQADYRNANM
jgi:uncharacterized protein YjbI with pentapeptide repeats